MGPSFKHGLKLLGLVAATIFLTAAKAPKVGELAPNFELTLIDGSKVTLDQLRGQVVVLNFWATWCVPCREELPLLDRYYELREKAGLKVFAIATEDSLPLFQMKKLFAVMHIPSARRIKGPYTTLQGVPTNYIIDRSGRIRYARAAAFDLDGLNETIMPLVEGTGAGCGGGELTNMG
jgi:cytochrome c biogenesis protein CcmG/thiol:disulfide interchange protein DsbE